MKSQHIQLFDNSTEDFSFGRQLDQLFRSGNFTEVSIATGYWDLPGMVELHDSLAQYLKRSGNKLRLLIGEEPSVKTYQVKNPQQLDPDFPERFLKSDLENLELRPEYQRIADLLLEGLSGGTLEVRVFRENFLHAKCYIFGSQEENAVGFIGSSNFTRKGLFGNLELNQSEWNNATVNYIRKNLNQHPSHRSWFEELWERSENWTQTFKEEVLDLSKHGGTCFSPYEMYIHALYRIYGQDLREEQQDCLPEDKPEDGKPKMLRFQVQNANRLIKKLETQGVAMLSDSVGLGKTYTSIKVVEYFMKTRNQRVIIIAPAGLIPQWRTAFDDFKIYPYPEIYSLQNTTEIEDVKSRLKSIPVGLFVFDESHNLRSSGGNRFDVFLRWRMENNHAATLLLTATPINNQLSDLTNQIMLGSGGNLHKLGKFFDRERQRNFTLKERLELIQKEMKRQIHDNGSINYPEIKEQLTPLLHRFIVRRTRQGIEKEYPDGLEINGKLQKFPKSIPLNLEYELSNREKSSLLKIGRKSELLSRAYTCEFAELAQLEFLIHPLDNLEYCTLRTKEIGSTLEVLYTGILGLGFPCYRFHMYKWAYYGRQRGELELNVDDNRELSRQIGIYGIFRTIFLKRMESSLYAIRLSLLSYEKKLLDFRGNLLNHGRIVSVKNQSLLERILRAYNEESAEEDELDYNLEDLEQENEKFTTLEAHPGIFHLEQLKEDIEKDLLVVSILKEQLDSLIKKDDKLQELAKELNNNRDQKVLVFTYFADTLKYLEKELPKFLIHNRNAEFALGTKADIESFARRFAPVSKRYTLSPGEKEIDYLLATDKLSEGQNLQDCGIIINYDLHWNPVRMIQRNGRINRLGSLFEEIYIQNFRPTEQLESYLQLVRKLEDKINLIRYTIGSDQSVLDEEPIPQDFTEDLYSRDEKKRLAAFQKIFETSELLAAEDLFLDDLRAFDQNPEHSQAYKTQIENLPKGKWGRIQSRKDAEVMDRLIHLEDESGEAGYFLKLDDQNRLEQLNTTEGLLYIQCGSTENTRFKDRFTRKPETEAAIRQALVGRQMGEEAERVDLAENHMVSLQWIITTMTEYGEKTETIERVYDCVTQSQNAYINKQVIKQLRLVARLQRQGKVLSSDVYANLIQLAESWNPDEPIEKTPISEILQIFA